MRPLPSPPPWLCSALLATAGACAHEAPPGADGRDHERSSAVEVPAQAGSPRLPAELARAAASASARPAASAAADAGSPAETAHAGPWFAVTSIAAAIYSEQSFDTKKKIGYVRNGGRVAITGERVASKLCSQGWYAVVGGGWLCGNLGTTDLEHPQVKAALSAPMLDQVLPYRYARNAKNGTPLYRTVPSREQMRQYEPYLGGAKKSDTAQSGAPQHDGAAKQDGHPRDGAKPDGAPKVATATLEPGPRPSEPAKPSIADAGAAGATQAVRIVADAGLALAPPIDAGDPEPEKPWWQREGEDAKLHELKLHELSRDADDVLAKRLVEGFYIAVDKQFAWNHRAWYKTTKGLVAPADRFWITEASKFKGVEVDGTSHELPLAWVYGGRKTAPKYEIDADKRQPKPAGTVERFVAIPLTGREQTLKGITYLEAREGWWVKSIHVRVTRPGPPPADLGPDERWIDVNLRQQTLVVFEGTRAIYATLVSSGKESTVKDKDHRTPTGEWRIREKHVTTTMDGDGTAAGDMPYSIEDVPYVMYFHESYALHGAFWHRNFGIQMSHGCVNLAPLDAKHVFSITDPRPPPSWHGVWASKDRPGSRVVLHE